MYLFYSPELKERLLSQLVHLHQALEWGQQIDAMPGSFHWPEEYCQGFQRSLQHIVDHAEQYRQLFALEQRFANLLHLQADNNASARNWWRERHSPVLTVLERHLTHNTPIDAILWVSRSMLWWLLTPVFF
jgi:hypothetical protein